MNVGADEKLYAVGIDKLHGVVRIISSLQTHAKMRKSHFEIQQYFGKTLASILIALADFLVNNGALPSYSHSHARLLAEAWVASSRSAPGNAVWLDYTGPLNLLKVY